MRRKIKIYKNKNKEKKNKNETIFIRDVREKNY